MFSRSAILIFAGFVALSGRESLAPALDSIKPEDVLRHGRYLASAELEGRDTPKPGLTLAGDYIAKELGSYGLLPGGVDGSFFQPFDLKVWVPDAASALSAQAGDASDDEKTYRLGEDFVPLWGSDEREVSGEVVFAGYGITASDETYDDYSGRKVTGKIALVLWHEPRENKKGSAFKGLEATDHSGFLSKARNAQEHGALGLLVVTDPKNHKKTDPIDFQFPCLRSPRPEKPENQVSIPMMHVSLAVAEAILGQPILPLQEKLDASLKGKLVPAKGTGVTMRVAFREETGHPRNVIGIYPGDGGGGRPSTEAVVLGAHYDHEGVNDKGEIFFGADDNASGCAALLEVAQALATTNPASRRRIVLVWFAGEEKGLLGSAAYVKDPVVPMEKTVAMLNVDMLGRKEPGEICGISRSKSPQLFASAERLASTGSIGLKLKSSGDEFFQRSDQYNFYKAGVPVLFFFSGVHEDYHRPTDTVDKIDTKKVSRVARLLLLTALDVANDHTPPPRPKPE